MAQKPGLKRGGLKTCCMQTLRLTLLDCTAAHLDLWASKQYVWQGVGMVERKLIDTLCMLRHVGALTKDCCCCPLLFRRCIALLGLKTAWSNSPLCCHPLDKIYDDVMTRIVINKSSNQIGMYWVK